MFGSNRIAGVKVMSRRNGGSAVTSATPMTREMISQYAPSIMADNKHESRSERYTYIPTIQIVDHLQSNGFGVFSVMQSGSRDESKRSHTKHLIRFRPLEQSLTVGGTFPEMVLINSHDGTSAYRLMAGLFRMVCKNGLIVAESVVDDYKVRHSGNILAEISDAVDAMRSNIPLIGSRVEQFQNVRLERQEQEIFARAALTAKYGDDSPISADQALVVRRGDDAEPTLWNTLNTVQESLIHGGQRYIKRTESGRVQRRTTGAVKSVDGNSTINRAVWQLAEEMAKLKA